MPNSGDIIERAKMVALRCASLAAKTPVAGEPDPHWWERQSALGDACDKIHELVAALSSLPQEDDRELVERLEMSASQSELGRNLAGTPQTCRAAADRLLQLSRDVDLLREALERIVLCVETGDYYRNIETHLANARAALSSGISEQGEM
jgi:hypothetical protein